MFWHRDRRKFGDMQLLFEEIRYYSYGQVMAKASKNTLAPGEISFAELTKYCYSKFSGLVQFAQGSVFAVPVLCKLCKAVFVRH